MQHPDNALTAIRFAPFRRSQRFAGPVGGVRAHPSRFPSLRRREMERREAPGRCATAPLHAPCDRGVYAPCGRVCEAHPEARASCDGGFARPAARTLRLPALHRGPRCWRPLRIGFADRVDSDPQASTDARSVRADSGAGITFFRRVLARMERSEIRDANRTGPALRPASGLQRRDEPARSEPRSIRPLRAFSIDLWSAAALAPSGEG